MYTIEKFKKRLELKNSNAYKLICVGIHFAIQELSVFREI